MGVSTQAVDAVDKLVRAVNSIFNGLKFDPWDARDKHALFRDV